MACVRQWEMLPRTTFVIPLRVEPGTHDVTVQFPPRYSLRHVGMDYDGDGRVSEEEFLAPMRDAFREMDKDGSGSLEEGERGGRHVIERRED